MHRAATACQPAVVSSEPCSLSQWKSGFPAKTTAVCNCEPLWSLPTMPVGPARLDLLAIQDGVSACCSYVAYMEFIWNISHCTQKQLHSSECTSDHTLWTLCKTRESQSDGNLRTELVTADTQVVQGFCLGHSNSSQCIVLTAKLPTAVVQATAVWACKVGWPYSFCKKQGFEFNHYIWLPPIFAHNFLSCMSYYTWEDDLSLQSQPCQSCAAKHGCIHF